VLRKDTFTAVGCLRWIVGVQRGNHSPFSLPFMVKMPTALTLRWKTHLKGLRTLGYVVVLVVLSSGRSRCATGSTSALWSFGCVSFCWTLRQTRDQLFSARLCSSWKGWARWFMILPGWGGCHGGALEQLFMGHNVGVDGPCLVCQTPWLFTVLLAERTFFLVWSQAAPYPLAFVGGIVSFPSRKLPVALS